MDRIWQKELCAKFGVFSAAKKRSIGCETYTNRCRFNTTAYLQAAKSAKKPPIKTHKPALAYKPRPPPPQPDLKTKLPPPPKKDYWNYRKTPLILSGLAIFGLTSYCTYLFVSFRKGSTTNVPKDAATQADVSSQYDKIARTFDLEVDRTEWLMGLPKLRKKLASQAHGDVLEVSIGTGRNLEYYDWDFKSYNGVGKPGKGGGLKKGKVRSFTAVDKSGEMLEIAHEKFSTMFPGILGVRWIIGDASETIPPPPRNSNERSGNLDGKKYDTIIQTMGLCSVDDPVALLKNLGNCVKEEEGRILLLEHGRGRWNWLNKILDQSAEGHAKAFGCWWNRDMDHIINESGLEVVTKDTWHGGTTWWIELKKPKGPLDKQREDTKIIEDKDEQKEDVTSTNKSRWW